MEIKREYRASFLSLPGVTGVGVGKADAHMLPSHLHVYALHHRVDIPSALADIPVTKVVTGPVKLLSLSAYALANQNLLRPYPGGASVGTFSRLLNNYVTGTLGIAVKDPSGNLALLSNNHVFAGLDTLQHGGAALGQDIIQPGPADAGLSSDRIATLSSWVPLDELGDNLVDCALATPSDLSQVDPSVLGIGPVTGAERASVNLPVVKSGRTTGVTTSVILDVDAAMSVTYGRFNFTFDHQLIIDNPGAAFAQEGDSGSVVVNPGSLKTVGLLFAGSGSIAVANRIEDVLSALSIPTGGPAAISGGGPSPLLSLGFIGVGAALLAKAKSAKSR